MLSFSLGQQLWTTLDNNKIIKLSLLSVLSFSLGRQLWTTLDNNTIK